MLENKVSLLLAFSDFSGLLWSEAPLSDLHLVRTITVRHQQVESFHQQGLTAKEIARRMAISERTVRRLSPSRSGS
jgi:DNA-binding NarL/FixJ family response regulator